MSPTSRRRFLTSCAATGWAFAKPAPPDVAVLKTPNGGLQPQAAVDSSGTIHLIYLYGDPAASDVAYVRKAAAESDFSRPIRVNDCPGSAVAIGTVRGAHLALGRDGLVHVAWNGSAKAEPKEPRGAVPMLYTRLDRSGKFFEPQRNMMQTATGLDGGGTLAADHAGHVYVVWHAQGQGDVEPIEGEGHRRVWLAYSNDDGRSFARERAVSPAETGACGCCGMGALADQKGNLYLLYRAARETVHRDMYLLISNDRGKTFRAVEVQPWNIGACPMSTVSLVQAEDAIFLSWETNKQVYFAEVNAAKSSIGEPIPAPGAGVNRKHPAVAVNKAGEILLSWTEGTGWREGGTLHCQLYDRLRQPLGARTQPSDVPVWSLPTSIAARNRFLVIC